jgi:putative ABC transport system permease protein
MIIHYLKSGLRSLVRNRVFSFINIFGLSLGLTCSLLIALWVNDEFAINKFHEDLNRLFIVTSLEFSGDERNGSYDTPGLLGDELKRIIPEIQYSCSYGWIEKAVFAVDDKRLDFEGSFAGEDFFKMFSYPFILGDRDALKSPQDIAISRKMATALFGSPESAIGKGLRYETYRDLKVTAVFEDLKDNVSEKFDYIINWKLFVERNNWVENWHNSGPTTFVKLHANVDGNTVSPKIREFIKNYDKEYSTLDRLELGLQPFGDYYLNSNFKDGYISGGRITYVRMFALVAVFTLLIACVNFMNLSTARAAKRAKEIGVRKVVGAMRKTLVKQFMTEAIFLTGIAVVFSLAILVLVLPYFNILADKNIVAPLSNPTFWTAIVGLTLITGVISGSYPALMLSSFKPISVLKNTLKIDPRSLRFRKGLVIFQFALSMIFVVAMIVVSQQVSYIRTKNLGYDKNNLVTMSITGTIATKFEVFKQEVLKNKEVISISWISQNPVLIGNTTNSVEWDGKSPGAAPTFTQAAVGYDFMKTMQATMLLGRDFSELQNDSARFIINESALRLTGYKDPIGMPLTFWDVKGTIVGVVKDFHFNSLHVPIKPLVLRHEKREHWGVALVRLKAGGTTQGVAAIEAVHKKINPEFPFTFEFADARYAKLYNSEQLVQQLSTVFAIMAIVISCLGLLGLVIFTAEQRTKEMGIRKILGAQLSNIVGMLAKDFIILVGLAAIISSPLSYYIMIDWLQGFEYAVTIKWWLFPLATAGLVTIALLTILYQAIATASANPVDSLKVE